MRIKVDLLRKGRKVKIETVGGNVKGGVMGNWGKLFREADEAGKRAVAEKICNGGVDAMIVVGGVPGGEVKKYYVQDGCCGFAWVNVKPGNGSFARWIKKFRGGRKDYYGGISIWISDYNQSMQKKECYAQAFAAVLVESGIRAYANSRMD